MDDGYANQWRYMAPMLEKRGFRGTFFLVTDWLDAEDHWPRWELIAARGHEIGSHSVTHRPLSALSDRMVANELRRSRLLIHDALGPDHGNSFAYPRSDVDPRLARLVEKAGYSAARAGDQVLNSPTPDELYDVHAHHPMATTSVAEMIGWVQDVKATGGWLVIGVHGIYDPRHRYPETQEGWEPLPVKSYAALLDHIKAEKKQLWVAPFGEVSRYIRQRETASSSVEEVSGSRIRVRLHGDAKDGTMAFQTSVPASWSKVKITVDGDERRALLPQKDDDAVTTRYVRYDAVPPAVIVLSPAGAPVAAARPR
jgi:peptidoglycan/xylan/chitin deacetylase (PgdA/CDA1 family)